LHVFVALLILDRNQPSGRKSSHRDITLNDGATGSVTPEQLVEHDATMQQCYERVVGRLDGAGCGDGKQQKFVTV
jgi:hypothetical protein